MCLGDLVETTVNKVYNSSINNMAGAGMTWRVTTVIVVVLLVLNGSAHALTLAEIQQAITEQSAAWEAQDNAIWQQYLSQGGWFPGQMPVLNGTEPVFLAAGRTDLPDHLDWRDREGVNWVTPVRDQGSCGACAAFATAAPIETAVAYTEGWAFPTLDLAEQDILSCSFNLGCDLGGLTTDAFNYARDVGIVDEDCFPYVEEKVPCAEKCNDWQSRVYRIDSWVFVGENPLAPTPQEIMEALQINPVATALILYEDFLTYYEGIYTTVIGLPVALHAMTIVGYDVPERYWICKNQWSSAWGEDGYIRIRWGAAQVGMFSMLPYYLPPVDDDTTDDDTADDDTIDDDTVDDDTMDDDTADDDMVDDDTTDDDAADDDTTSDDDTADDDSSGDDDGQDDDTVDDDVAADDTVDDDLTTGEPDDDTNGSGCGC